MDFETLWPFELTRGHSKDPRSGACLMDAVSWFEYNCLSDAPPCVSPIVRSLSITLNDLFDREDRQKLKYFIPLVVGTNTSTELEAKRLALTESRLNQFLSEKYEQGADLAIHQCLITLHHGAVPYETLRSKIERAIHQFWVWTGEHGHQLYSDKTYNDAPVLAFGQDGTTLILKTAAAYVHPRPLMVQDMRSELLSHLLKTLELICAIRDTPVGLQAKDLAVAVDNFQRARETV